MGAILRGCNPTVTVAKLFEILRNLYELQKNFAFYSLTDRLTDKNIYRIDAFI